MTRIATFAAALLIAGPAVAGSYTAQPAAPAQGSLVARDANWSCNGTTCKLSTDQSRPLVLCQGLAKRAGRLDSFIADGRAFGADELAKCNTAAKGGAVALAKAN